MIQSTVYARVGLAGNPSDGFDGKTLSACVRNWGATIELVPHDCGYVEIIPNLEMDRLRYDSLKSLVDHTERFGHYGALRLIHAACALFYKTYGIDIGLGYGFNIAYGSNIPRQVGLGGSSAIIVALLNCLYEHFEHEVSLEERAHLAWAVENQELGITAGLQDRVIQTYGGLVFMDFSQECRTLRDYGHYKPLDYPLPSAFIAYTNNPRKNSGQVHNEMFLKYKAGDRWVSQHMYQLAEMAKGALLAVERQQAKSLGHIMDANFQLRLDLYGEDKIGEDNMTMRRIALQNDCSAKLPGSGGAIVGLYYEDKQYDALMQAYRDNGFECVKVIWDQ